MATIGPALPPHLTRKRRRSGSDSSEDDGPQPPPAIRARSKSPASDQNPSKVFGPTLPLTESDSEKTARSRVIGPSLPPSLSEVIQESNQATVDADESSDEDDIGPSLPPSGGIGTSSTLWGPDSERSIAPVKEKPLQRAEWMLAPPSGADWATRIDPTKLKSRKFNTMKGAKAPSSRDKSEIGGLWTETPEEKRKRLQDEVMGARSTAVTKQNNDGNTESRRRREEEDRETARRIREYNDANRGSASLLESHRSRKGPEAEEDDPSKRAFDREKDIAGGAMSAMQRREALSRAKNIGSRFEKARYL